MRDSYPLCQSQVEENRAYGIPSFGSPGRLAQSTDSGAGKRRIFAIGNYVNQRLLKLSLTNHEEALATLPMDGTYNQVSPLDRLVGAEHVSSYDLKPQIGGRLIYKETFWPSHLDQKLKVS